MQARNKTRKTLVTHDLKKVTSLSDKLFGLHNKANPRSLLFETRFGIHTFFLNSKIDVIVLDNNDKVAIAKTVRPNTVFSYSPKYRKIMELPLYTIKKSKTRKGDKIVFSDNI